MLGSLPSDGASEALSWEGLPGDVLPCTLSMPIWFGAGRRLGPAVRGDLGVPKGT